MRFHFLYHLVNINIAYRLGFALHVRIEISFPDRWCRAFEEIVVLNDISISLHNTQTRKHSQKYLKV